MTDVFVIRVVDQEVWRAIVDGRMVKADFNCKGAALAAILTERARRVRREVSK